MNELLADDILESHTTSRSVSVQRANNAILAKGTEDKEITEAILRVGRLTNSERLRLAAAARRAFENNRRPFFKHMRRLTCLIISRTNLPPNDNRCYHLHRGHGFADILPDYTQIDQVQA